MTPNKTSIEIDKAEIIDGKIIIHSMNIIDKVSGEILRSSKLTPELLEFLKTIEIGVDNYFYIMDMKKRKPELTKFIETFKLYT